MKKLACVLLLLVLGVSTIGAASAADPMQVPYSVPDEQVTGQMRTERLAMLEKYPGLTTPRRLTPARRSSVWTVWRGWMR